MTKQRTRTRATRQPQPLDTILGSVLRSYGMAERYQGWQTVVRWPEIVGEHIARVSRAFRYDDGTLYVAVEDPSWRQNLSMESEQILRTIHQYPFGRVVKQLRLMRSEKG